METHTFSSHRLGLLNPMQHTISKIQRLHTTTSRVKGYTFYFVPTLTVTLATGLTGSSYSNVVSNSSISSSPLSLNPFPRLSTKNPSRSSPIYCQSVSMVPPNATQYEISDCQSDVELRIFLTGMGVESSREITADADETALVVRLNRPGSVCTLLETKQLYGRIKPGETIWYLDEDQLVINLRKQDSELKWPDIVESWESLSTGLSRLLGGASIYLVGNSSEINSRVAQELAVGLGYTPLDTKELLETLVKTRVETLVDAEGAEAVAEGEAAVLESLSSHVRAVIATMGDQYGAARREGKWRHLYAGFTVWLSLSDASDEESAKKEARKQVSEGNEAYSKADVVVKLNGWDADHAKSVAQASLSGLKQLILSDKKLPGKKSLYIRLGCRGDWPNIMPPGWDPSGETSVPPS